MPVLAFLCTYSQHVVKGQIMFICARYFPRFYYLNLKIIIEFLNHTSFNVDDSSMGCTRQTIKSRTWSRVHYKKIKRTDDTRNISVNKRMTRLQTWYKCMNEERMRSIIKQLPHVQLLHKPRKNSVSTTEYNSLHTRNVLTLPRSLLISCCVQKRSEE